MFLSFSWSSTFLRAWKPPEVALKSLSTCLCQNKDTWCSVTVGLVRASQTRLLKHIC
jgi:hypothetical protein